MDRALGVDHEEGQDVHGQGSHQGRHPGQSFGEKTINRLEWPIPAVFVEFLYLFLKLILAQRVSVQFDWGLPEEFEDEVIRHLQDFKHHGDRDAQVEAQRAAQPGQEAVRLCSGKAQDQD